MKRIHFLLMAMFVTSCAMAFGADIAEMTLSPAPSAWQAFLSDVLYPGIIAVLSYLLGRAVNMFNEWVRKQTATIRHGQIIGIVYDAVALAVSKRANAKGKRYAEMLKDLTLDAEERAEIAQDAEEIASELLTELRGYVKDKSGKYLAERIDLALGELQSRLTDSEIESEESLANSPAVES